MGGALGGAESMFLPHEGVGFWPLVSMAATLGGTMRAPLTAIVFALELTHDINMLLPLLLAVSIAHGFTVLLLRRSILTEKVARRGYHLSAEYSVDPLENLSARDVLRSDIVTLAPVVDRAEAAAALDRVRRGQLLYPIVDDHSNLLGVVTRGQLRKLAAEPGVHALPLAELANRNPQVAFPDEPLSTVVARMAETGLTRFPVVERSAARRLLGMISIYDLLRARTRALEEEGSRERVLRFHLPFASR